MKRQPTAIRPLLLPVPGARVGIVCGPGQMPQDDAGSVLCLVTDRFGTSATVLMDSGRTTIMNCITSIGIGFHLIAGEIRPIGFTNEYEAHCRQHDLNILTAPDVDLDGSFLAWDLDETDFITVHGWNWTFELVEPPTCGDKKI